MLASDVKFVDAHVEPVRVNDQVLIGQKVTLTLPHKGTVTNYVVKPESHPKATILVFHEWWGLNENIMATCDSIYRALDQSVTVIGVDLYSGFVTQERKEAAAFMDKVNDAHARMVIEATLATVGMDQKIGTVGWCFGGGWSLQSSIIAGDRAAACVIYYGMPELQQDPLKKLHAPVLGIYATKDDWITPELVSKFETAMKEAKKQLTVQNYVGVHAFANPSNPSHDVTATADAFKRTIDFFTQHLIK